MKLITAQEANRLSKENYYDPDECYVQSIFQLINRACLKGYTSIEYVRLNYDQFRCFNNLGYNVKKCFLTDNFYNISWDTI